MWWAYLHGTQQATLKVSLFLALSLQTQGSIAETNEYRRHDTRDHSSQVSINAGRTVEMHGSIKQMVCPDVECKAVVEMDDSLMLQLLKREHIHCSQCQCESIRYRIMLYDDKDGEHCSLLSVK